MPRQPATARFGAVSLRKKGKWWSAYWTSHGHRSFLALKVTTYEAAVEKAQQINLLLERGEYITAHQLRTRKRITFSELIDEFKTNYTGWSDATFKAHNGFMEKLRGEWGDLPLEAITPKLIESWRARRLDSGEITPGTTNRYLSFIRRCLEMGVRWGYLERNVAKEVTMLKEANKIPPALTDAEVDALLQQLPSHTRTVVLFALDTGLRRAELFGLTWSAVDLDRRTITVYTSKNKSFRVLPLTVRAWRLLADLRRNLPRSGDVRVFPYADLKKSLSGAGHRAGIGHVHMHMLRHTFATRLRDRGVPLDRIMELLGHKSLQMVLRYAKARPVQLTDAIATLDQPLSIAPSSASTL